MLQFIFGKASFGKTHTVLNMLKNAVLEGKKVILLVPEQFSFESERAVLRLLGDKKASLVEVMSFTRLCDQNERIVGGNAAKTVNESAKVILMSRAIKESREELSLWKGYSSVSFAENLLSTITEFKYNAIYPEDLKVASEKATDGYLSQKLHDLSVIFFRYNSLLAERFIDPDDRLDKLYSSLEKTEYFKGKTVFIDSFKTFSVQQFKIIKRILSSADDITVSLINNPDIQTDLGLFSSVQKTAEKIRAYAKSISLEIKEDIILKNSHYKNPSMDLVERVMTGENAKAEKSEGITVIKAENRYFEADAVARNIRRLVKEKNLRYSDFVIIARDTSLYEDALVSACEKNGVYCFIDRKVPLSALPMAVAVKAALQLARRFSTENILRFHKSGISVLKDSEIFLLENYTYLWGIEGSLWESEWDMNPKGFTNFEKTDEKTEKKLKEINELRIKALAPLKAFKDNFKGNTERRTLALIRLLEECKAAEGFKKLYNHHKEMGNTVFADALLSGFDELMELFDSLVKALGESEITTADYCDALSLSIQKCSVGVIPQMIDEVIFGDAERIRPSRPKYAFIMGANQGVFPKAVTPSGIFSRAERLKLKSLNIEMPDRTLEGVSEEELLVYTNTCCATDGLFISYSLSSDAGDGLEPSAFVTKIIKQLKCDIKAEPDILNEESLPQTKEAAFSEFCRRYPDNKDDAFTCVSSLLDDSTLKIRTDAVLGSLNAPEMSLTPETAKGLFGKKISMSSSKYEDLSCCSFMYFCKDGLGVRKLQPAKFDTMQRGSLIHSVLDRVISKYKKDVKNLTDEQLVFEVDLATEAYLDSINGYRSIETDRLKYLVSTMKRSLYTVVKRIRDEFLQSDFEPLYCELKIGLDGDIKDIEIPLEDDGILSLHGIVDRVDTWNGYIRVVDYKTGTKTFRLPDVLAGQNMQMLLYLYALIKTEEIGEKAAGILYMPAKRNLGKEKKDKRMNGLLVADMDLITAMEKENSGEFVPKLSEKKPSSSFISDEDFDILFEYITKKLTASGNRILRGEISPNPVDGLEGSACKYCDFSAICRIKNEKHQEVPKLSNGEVISEMRGDN